MGGREVRIGFVLIPFYSGVLAILGTTLCFWIGMESWLSLTITGAFSAAIGVYFELFYELYKS